VGESDEAGDLLLAVNKKIVESEVKDERGINWQATSSFLVNVRNLASSAANRERHTHARTVGTKSPTVTASSISKTKSRAVAEKVWWVVLQAPGGSVMLEKSDTRCGPVTGGASSTSRAATGSQKEDWSSEVKEQRTGGCRRRGLAARSWRVSCRGRKGNQQLASDGLRCN
jgi:hypothetical protein